MRKFGSYLLHLSFCQFVILQVSFSQTISSQKGLTTAIFPTQYGNVKVYLPDDIRPGVMISGTVVAEPKGNNARQSERNLAELVKFSVNINGNKFAVTPNSSSFKWLVHQDRQLTTPMELLHVSGYKAGELPIQFKTPDNNQSAPEGCVIPSHALTDAPCRITGNFDGDASNTKCTLNNQPVQVLAESPRQCQVLYPQNGKGLQTFQVSEKGEEKCKRQTSGVDMQVTTGDLDLRKGQGTFIDVRLTDLQNLPDKAILTIINTTPNVVTMTNGNTQVIPVWPPPDSANGTFFIHCPAVAITTGNFVVQINLDLPQPGDVLTPASECPPGYTKKSCDCGASVKITKSGNSLKAVASSECKGVWGVGINTFPVCSVLSTTYSWTIEEGKDNVELVGKTDGKDIIIRPKNKLGYKVCVTVTVKCIDGTTCTASDCVTETGERTPPPSSKCSCSASCVIIPGVSKGNSAEFSAKVDAKCSGTSGTGETRVKCEVASVAYSWSIGASGKDVAEIDGKPDGPAVKVKRKKEGAYNLILKITVTCSDKTTCDFECNAEIPYIPTIGEKICLPEIKPDKNPPMVGGLKSKQVGSGTETSTIYRDGFVAMEATGSDMDLVKFMCEPQKPPCPDTRSEKSLLIAGKVRFEWKITDGDGRFVKLGCAAEDEKNEKGEHVIFQPPFVPLPVINKDTFKITKIILTIIDDGSPALDDPVEKIITIKTIRKKAAQDKYTVEVSGGTPDKPATASSPPEDGTCKLEGLKWQPGDNLAVPDIILPAAADPPKMVLGQWIVLRSQDQKDEDALPFSCVSANCNGSPANPTYPDKIIWEWSTVPANVGKFILGPNGQQVIYEAPLVMPDKKEVIEVTIKVKVMNEKGERKDPDKNSVKEVILRIYQPGVKLSQPKLSWLPEDDNNLELKSELMYKEGGEWLPALSHMCRIQFFELMNVSTEKGVCLNSPLPDKADDCRDLQLKKEEGQEAWNETKESNSKCNTKGLFLQARTQQPVKEYSIKIYSRDFGSYGFLRSFANVYKTTGKNISFENQPVYISIPFTKEEAKHPKRGQINKAGYEDNRVAIPHDIDENHIADNGWKTQRGRDVADPAKNNGDEDDSPEGNKTKGDGLTAYEEYRGFKILAGKDIVHIRTDPERKDIFIRNVNDLNIGLYADVTSLEVHEIKEDQYLAETFRENARVINFNSNQEMHVVNQKAVRIKDAGDHPNLLGIACETSQCLLNGDIGPPNWIFEVRIYPDKIRRLCNSRNVDYRTKLAQTVAHELCHTNNVCHHGEGEIDNAASSDNIHGLRSGNIACIMRYDNVGTQIQRQPETPGNTLCTSSAGTGYNVPGNRPGFESAADGRGNCRGQIQVTGKGTRPEMCKH